MEKLESSPKPIPPNWAPRFFTIWTAQALSLLGSAIVQFAMVWWLTQETGSATVLSLATLAAVLPQIIVGPFAGPLVDRWDRRRIMIVADAAIAAATFILLLLFATDQVQVWQIYAIAAIRSLAGAFHNPAMTASTSLMVPDQHLARVAGANQTLQGLISIFAPPLAALFIELMSIEFVLLIDIGTALLAVAPLLFFDIPRPTNQSLQAEGRIEQTSYFHDLREGFSYVVKWKGLLGVLILAMLLNFMVVPAASLLPLVVTEIFNGGAVQLAALESALGIGMILGGIVLGIWGGFKRRIVTSLTAIIGIGIGILLVGLIPSDLFQLLMFAYFFVGIMQVFANGPLMAILQSVVAPAMQGRVISLLVAGATAMMPLSLLIAGPISDALGIRFWYILGGTTCVLMTITAFFIPAIMNIENNHEAVLNPADQ